MVMPSKLNSANYAQSAQKAAAIIAKQKKPLVPTPRIKAALEAMVFEGLKRDKAAKKAGLTDHAVRTALTKPHVLAYLNECQEVLRTGLRPRALHKMGQLLDAKAERIQFEAAKYLDGMDRPTHAVGAINVQVNNHTHVELPGYVIDISDAQAQANSAKQIDHLPADDDSDMISIEDVPDDE